VIRAVLGAAAIALGSLVFGCGASEVPRGNPPGGAPTHVSERTSPDSSAPAPGADRVGVDPRAVQSMLRRVAAKRGLPIRREVPSRVLNRAAIIARIREHVDRELPRDVLSNQGESLAALELIPVDYDFVAGVFALIEGRIAGFYEPEDGTMYLVDDLDDAEAAETLAHELCHALQDQSFPLAPLLKFSPTETDRLAAAHAIVEGDATSAMLDVSQGDAFAVDPEALRFAFSFAAALSSVGATPRVLQSSLTAPYVDGFALVQELRRRGGWPAVDGVLRSLPASTEQLLHIEKLDAHEPPIVVSVPPIDALGAGWTVALDDVMGEQGLRISLEEWTSRADARRAAAGWGGDRYVVARKTTTPADPRAPQAVAFAWHIRMDTTADAREVGAVLERRFGGACRERATSARCTGSVRIAISP